MPSYISKLGKWEAAKERAFIPKTGEIYDGPDRAAMEVLKENGGDMGQDALKDPQLLQASRNAGFTSIEEYISYYTPKPEEIKAIEEAQQKIVTHANPEPKPGVESGTLGGFHDETETPDTAMETKRRGRPRKV
jgi:hypothetical protein